MRLIHGDAFLSVRQVYGVHSGQEHRCTSYTCQAPMSQSTDTPRKRLSRARVLEAAVALADQIGLEAFSMRGLAQELGVVPMALYKHFGNKDELLDEMVDAVFDEMSFSAS